MIAVAVGWPALVPWYMCFGICVGHALCWVLRYYSSRAIIVYNDALRVHVLSSNVQEVCFFI